MNFTNHQIEETILKVLSEHEGYALEIDDLFWFVQQELKTHELSEEKFIEFENLYSDIICNMGDLILYVEQIKYRHKKGEDNTFMITGEPKKVKQFIQITEKGLKYLNSEPISKYKIINDKDI
jgi:hypothetical protein